LHRWVLSKSGARGRGRASSGADAVRLARTLGPDVALLDFQLGDEDGLGLTRRLAADARETPVILISTHSENELAELIVGSPAVGFLPKEALGANAIVGLLR
jgi:DNA-binding NarL/FixJ family response regulator